MVQNDTEVAEDMEVDLLNADDQTEEDTAVAADLAAAAVVSEVVAVDLEVADSEVTEEAVASEVVAGAVVVLEVVAEAADLEEADSEVVAAEVDAEEADFRMVADGIKNWESASHYNFLPAHCHYTYSLFALLQTYKKSNSVILTLTSGINYFFHSSYFTHVQPLLAYLAVRFILSKFSLLNFCPLPPFRCM